MHKNEYLINNLSVFQLKNGKNTFHIYKMNSVNDGVHRIPNINRNYTKKFNEQ